MEQVNNASSNGQGLGIAGLILGIVALVVSFIPCIGLLALIPGIIAVVFSAIALNQANRTGSAKGIIIAALVISILGTSMAGLWGLFFASTAREGVKVRHKLEKISKEFEDGFEEEFDKEMKESVEKSMEEVLEELESEKESLKSVSEKEMKKARKVGKATGKAAKTFMKEMEDADSLAL